MRFLRKVLRSLPEACQIACAQGQCRVFYPDPVVDCPGFRIDSPNYGLVCYTQTPDANPATISELNFRVLLPDGYYESGPIDRPYELTADNVTGASNEIHAGVPLDDVADKYDSAKALCLSLGGDSVTCPNPVTQTTRAVANGIFSGYMPPVPVPTETTTTVDDDKEDYGPNYRTAREFSRFSGCNVHHTVAARQDEWRPARTLLREVGLNTDVWENFAVIHAPGHSEIHHINPSLYAGRIERALRRVRSKDQ